MPIRIVIVDDHPVVLQGLVALFAAEPDLDVVARCLGGAEAVEAVRVHRPDVLVLDLQMPRLDGFATLRAMKQDALIPAVVLLTAVIDDDATLEAVRLGVAGIVLKEMAPQLLVQCIRKVHAGEQWLERQSVGRALDTLLRREAGVRDLGRVLTRRELEIVRLVARGFRNTRIAEELGVSEATIKTQLHHIYEKLGVDGRTGLMVLAHEKRLA